MKENYELKYHRLEKEYWWCKSRRDILFRIIKNFDKNSKILDAGCASGILISFLKEKGITNVYGIDNSKEAIKMCKKTLKNVFLMDASKTRFKKESFDIIIASDILEHIENEEKTLSEWHRILKPDGTLILFVPAFNFLWSVHDKINNHQRRYNMMQLRESLDKNRFLIKRSSYWNFTLFIPTAIMKLFKKILNSEEKDDFIEINPAINNFLFKLMKFENEILEKGINFPFGISLFAIAKKC